MMTEIIFPVFLGTLLGSLVGLVPGIGPALILLSVLPFLGYFDLVSLFAFYACLLSSSQYFGSVSAIVYGVPGEISSVPAVKNGHPLFLKGQGVQALCATSTGSFLASLWGVFLMLMVYINIEQLLWFYDIRVIVFIFLSLLTLMVFYTKNRLLSFVCLVLGLVAGKIGFDGLFMTHFLVPQYTILDAGIPFYAFFSGLIVIPTLYKYACKSSCSVDKKIEADWPSLPQRLKHLINLPSKMSIVRGTLIGSIMGLVPGVSYILSSNVADSVEKKLNDSKLSRLVAAESANNCAAITVLLPLLFLGVPIVFSEAIIMSVAEGKGFGYSVSLDFVKNHIPTIAFAIVCGNAIAWLWAGVFYSTAVTLYTKSKQWIYHAMLALVVFIVFWVGYSENQFWLAVSVMTVSSVIGKIIKHEDSKFVLVFAFFLSDYAIDNFYRLLIIYS